jgi:carboxypeptidase C (cathepsin A)
MIRTLLLLPLFLFAQLVETSGSIQLNGKPFPYKATAGKLELKDEKGKPKAYLYFTAYSQEKSNPSRPITYCFNGGPGCPSIWLHMGAFGPKRVMDGKLIDNIYSLLDLTDLVFIDPVSTGYSRVAEGVDPKIFYGYEPDVTTMADFIRLYTTQFNRWNSPKFLIGESYGTTRAAGVASKLQSDHSLGLSGVILISAILNWDLQFNDGNDLAYLLYLPTYAAAAWYHNKGSGDLPSTLKEAETFAIGEYASALLQGDSLSIDARKKITTELARFTSLKPDDILQSNLRINADQFNHMLLLNENRVISVYDARLKGIPPIDPDSPIDFTYTAQFNDYVRNTLKYTTDEEYVLFANVQPWNYSSDNQALNVSEQLRNAMSLNPTMRLFIASGYYDLATPYFTVDYTVNHLNLDPSLTSHLTHQYYSAGHMVYKDEPSAKKLKSDLTQFYQSALKPQNNITFLIPQAKN